MGILATTSPSLSFPVRYSVVLFCGVALVTSFTMFTVVPLLPTPVVGIPHFVSAGCVVCVLRPDQWCMGIVHLLFKSSYGLVLASVTQVRVCGLKWTQVQATSFFKCSPFQTMWEWIKETDGTLMARQPLY